MQLGFVEILILTVTVLYVLYKYGTSTYNHWAKQGLVQMDPKVPFLGSVVGFILRKFHPADGTKIMYDTFSNKTKMFGFYSFRSPWLMVKDPDVLKTIMIKDFDYFTDRNPLGTSDPEAVLLGKDLISLRGQAWKDLRNTLSPAFTSAKIKLIFEFVSKCGEQLTDYIEKKIKEKKSSENEVEEDFKSLFTRFSADVIATAAFGLQVDSLKDPENEFYKNGTRMINFNIRALVMFLVLSIYPKLMRIFNMSFFETGVLTYFWGIINSSIKMREEKKLLRHDLVHLMLEARKGDLKNDNDEDSVETSKGKILYLSDHEIATNCVLFFFAGFETVSTALCFMLHEIAVHPDVQARLRNEMDDVVSENDGKITYDGLIHQMKYLDMVVSESLRKWPPMFTSERQVSKPYTFKIEGLPQVKVNTGDIIMIPIYAIHRDPNNYPDPDKFDPERFNEENKSKIKPYTYLPFGAGPRSCIGNRLALMEIKMCLVHLLRKFEISPAEGTKRELKLDRLNVVSLAAEGGFNYKLKLRDDLPEI